MVSKSTIHPENTIDSIKELLGKIRLHVEEKISSLKHVIHIYNMVDIITICLSVGLAIVAVLWTTYESKKTIKKTTDNLIDSLILGGIIPEGIGIHQNKKNQVVKPVSKLLSIRYNIEKSNKRSPV